MTTDIQLFEPDQIQNLIYTVRGVQVMLDSDLAKLYGVETKVLNQAVKRNTNRFPIEFRFQITSEELEKLNTRDEPSGDLSLRSQIVTAKKGRGGRRTLPYAFTEQGVAMLSAVLRSKTAIEVSVQIMNAFVAMRRFIGANQKLFQRVDQIELKQLRDKSEIDEKFEKVFDAIEGREISPKQGLVYDGQVFDAHAFVSKIIRSAKKSITIIDNYVDTSVLTLLTDRRKGVKVRLYTKAISKRLALDVKKFNEQYGQLQVEERTDIHDRFIIIDDKTIYHTGASLKDLGKKVSAFSRFDKGGLETAGETQMTFLSLTNRGNAVNGLQEILSTFIPALKDWAIDPRDSNSLPPEVSGFTAGAETRSTKARVFTPLPHGMAIAHRSVLWLALLLTSCVELPTEAYTNPLDRQTQSELGIDPPALVFSPDSVSVSAGNAVTVNVFVMGAENLRGAHLQIDYDNSLVSFTTATIGELFNGGTESILLTEDDIDSGLLDVYVSFVGADSLSVSGNGNIANITFGTLASGKTVLTFTSASELADPDDNAIEIKGYGEGVIDAR